MSRMITMGNPLNNYIILSSTCPFYCVAVAALPYGSFCRWWVYKRTAPPARSTGRGALSLGLIVITQGKANCQSVLPKITATVLLSTGCSLYHRCHCHPKQLKKKRKTNVQLWAMCTVTVKVKTFPEAQSEVTGTEM